MYMATDQGLATFKAEAGLGAYLCHFVYHEHFCLLWSNPCLCRAHLGLLHAALAPALGLVTWLQHNQRAEPQQPLGLLSWLLHGQRGEPEKPL